MRFENEVPARLKDLLASSGRRLGVDDAVATGRVFSRWVDIVGTHVGAHAEPTSLKNGVLRIRTESPVWATEIGYLAGEIRDRVNKALASTAVKEVVVWTGPGPLRGAPARTSAPAAGSSTERSEAGSVDPEGALERAHEAWARRRSRGRQ